MNINDGYIRVVLLAVKTGDNNTFETVLQLWHVINVEMIFISVEGFICMHLLRVCYIISRKIFDL